MGGSSLTAYPPKIKCLIYLQLQLKKAIFTILGACPLTVPMFHEYLPTHFLLWFAPLDGAFFMPTPEEIDKANHQEFDKLHSEIRVLRRRIQQQDRDLSEKDQLLKDFAKRVGSLADEMKKM